MNERAEAGAAEAGQAAAARDAVAAGPGPPLLAVRGLRTEFGGLPAVDGVDFDVGRSEVLGIVGESGSGKSVTAMSILRLIAPPGRIAGGQVLFEGEDLLCADERRMEEVRGGDISMIFQEPMTALNPILTVGAQIVETVRRHHGVGRRAALRRAVDMLGRVGIPAPERRVHDYPHQMSGGMRQRVMIAMALACNPKLLIADEPTTALDVTIQAQILDLLSDLQREFHMSVILITHDLGVVAEFVDRVAVMYAGKVVETAEVDEVFDSPLHPYTAGLLASIPSVESDHPQLRAIPGVVPAPFELPPGCRFAPRCSFAREPCDAQPPPLRELRRGHAAACIRHTRYRFDGPVELRELDAT